MPEGDTIYKLAAYLDAQLRDATLRRVRLQPRFGPSTGPRCVRRVTSEGKHLFVTFDDATQLRSHLGMYGAWHRYGYGEPWRKPARQASVVLEAERSVYVCFNAKEVQWLKLHGFTRADQSNRLGPDLIGDAADADAILRRVPVFAAAQTLLVDLLLDQRVAAGIGNVYKSELLFLEGLSPWTRLADVAEVRIAALYARAAELLADNLGGGPRTTRRTLDRRGHLWVYGRSGLPCLQCGASVQRARLGANPRSTYWCAQCQRI
jgi:endonuclease-8